jgi:uncharacterized membrane protein YcaP (DUF421 family)
MEIIIRVAVTYIFVIFGLRILGKRELSELSAIELVTLMLVPEIVSQALGADGSMVDALIGVSTLFVLVFFTSLLSYLIKPAQEVIEGKALVLKDDHGLQTEAMDKERISVDEIFATMRHAGFDDLKQIRTIVLEADGQLSFIPHEADRAQQEIKQKGKSLS